MQEIPTPSKVLKFCKNLAALANFPLFLPFSTPFFINCGGGVAKKIHGKILYEASKINKLRPPKQRLGYGIATTQTMTIRSRCGYLSATSKLEILQENQKITGKIGIEKKRERERWDEKKGNK